MIPIGVRRGCPPSSGGGGSSLPNSADPDVTQLDLPKDVSTGTIRFNNTIQLPGAASVTIASGPFSVDPPSDVFVPAGGFAEVVIKATSSNGPESGTISVKSTSGTYSIPVTSDVTDVPVGLGALAAYDWIAQPYADGADMPTLIDSSANGHDADGWYWTAGVNSNRIGTGLPTMSATALGGLPGTSDFTAKRASFLTPTAIAQAMITASEGTAIAVGRFRGTGLPSSRGAAICASSSQFGAFQPYVNDRWYDAFGSNNARIINGVTLSGAEKTELAAPCMVLWEAQAGSVRIELNNVHTIGSANPGTLNFGTSNVAAGISGANGTKNIPLTSFANRIRVGVSTEYASGAWFHGVLSYVAFFDRVLSTADKAAIYAYLKTRFGL